MAKLSSFKISTKAVETGEWVRVGGGFGDLEILSRGVGDEYIDARKRMVRAAASKHGGDEDLITNAEWRAINTGLAVDHLVVDVRNIEYDDGKPIDAEAFRVLLADPDYNTLVNACLVAGARVGRQQVEELQAAIPSSDAPSA